jgi:hypothetical protein
MSIAGHLRDHKRLRPAPATLTAVICAMSIVLLSAGGAPGADHWAESPYRITAFVSTNPGDFTAAERESLLREWSEQVATHCGAAWRFTAQSATPEMDGEIATRLDALDADAWTALVTDAVSVDKHLLVRIVCDAGGHEIAVREFDFTTRQFGSVIRRRARGRPRVSQELLRAALDAFSPLIALQRATGDTVVGTVRAAALVDDGSPLLVARGAPLISVIRVEDRLGRSRSEQITRLPLTVLEVTSVDAAEVTCKIHSATRHRLGARTSLRLARYGLAVRPSQRPTRIVLNSLSTTPQPLVDYELVEAGETADPLVIGRTDFRGAVELAADRRSWRMIYVRQGDHLLARLPIIVGWEPEVTVSLPSNDVRLRAEGFAAALQEEVIDTVARRQILAARLKQRLAAGDYDDAEKILGQLQRLATSRQFEQRLQQARTQFVGENARVQQHIDALFLSTRQSLARYLDPKEIERYETQLAEARRAR